jgi:hypothetical protein
MRVYCFFVKKSRFQKKKNDARQEKIVIAELMTLGIGRQDAFEFSLQNERNDLNGTLKMSTENLRKMVCSTVKEE